LSDTDAADLVVPETPPSRRVRWRAVVMLLGIVGLAIAAFSTVDNVREQALPNARSLALAFALQVVALVMSARAWGVLFPPGSDRRMLASGLYTSQLTKYLPAGGFVQAASQVALSTPSDLGIGVAALRLPVFSLCTLVAGASLSSVLAFDADLAVWARCLAACGVASVLLLHRGVLAAALRAARRVVGRLPDPSNLPPQGAIVRCWAFALVSMSAYGVTFAVLIGDLADVRPVWAAAAFCAAWAAGYVVLPLPSGLGIREAAIIAVLPGLPTGSLLAASVAHRLTGFLAEVLLAGGTQLRGGLRRRRAAVRTDGGQPPAGPEPRPAAGRGDTQAG
jgi:uncharacterized membrane protein YbhN (UPF0104 family)